MSDFSEINDANIYKRLNNSKKGNAMDVKILESFCEVESEKINKLLITENFGGNKAIDNSPFTQRELQKQNYLLGQLSIVEKIIKIIESINEGENKYE